MDRRAASRCPTLFEVEEEQAPVVSPILRQAVLLTKWQRLSAALIGLCASGAGGSAVFLTDNQAGSTALLLFGGLALLIGVTGRVPDRIGREGVNYEPVDPATRAVENVLSDDDVPLELKEVIALAVRDELDRRRLDSVRSVQSGNPPSDRLSAQADAILFEAAVRNVIRTAVPPEAVFVTSVRTGSREFDGIIQRPGVEAEPYAGKIIIEVTIARSTRQKIEAELNRFAHIRPGGLVVIAKEYSSPRASSELKEWFRNRANSLNLSNAHLTFFEDESEASARELSSIINRAWEGLPSGGRPS